MFSVIVAGLFWDSFCELLKLGVKIVGSMAFVHLL